MFYHFLAWIAPIAALGLWAGTYGWYMWRTREFDRRKKRDLAKRDREALLKYVRR